MADVIEAAKTGRAKCRRCGEKIDKGALRFGERVPNAFGEGEATLWFHVACGAEKRPEKLLVAIDAFDGEIDDVDAIRAVCRAGVDNPGLVAVKRAERAPTGRARCQKCRETIDKGSLRVAVEREDEMAMASVSFVHARCAREHVGESGLLEKLRRVSTSLSDEDRALLESALDGSD